MGPAQIQLKRVLKQSVNIRSMVHWEAIWDINYNNYFIMGLTTMIQLDGAKEKFSTILLKMHQQVENSQWHK